MYYVETPAISSIIDVMKTTVWRESRFPARFLEDQQYQNARMNSGRQNAQVELNSALRRLVTLMVRCHTELYKAYTEDGEFREWLNAEMFRATTTDEQLHSRRK